MRDERVAGSIRGDHDKAVSSAFERALSEYKYWLEICLPKRPDGTPYDEPAARTKVPGIPFGNTRVLSSDLTAASDLLPLDLVKALVDGFLAGAKWSESPDK